MSVIGTAAPEFQLPDANGRIHRRPAGQAAVVYFTSNRCPTARAWQPRLNDVAADYRSRDVAFVAINVPCQFPGPVGARLPMRDGAEGVAAEIGKPEWSEITYLIDADLTAARHWQAQIVPDVFVIDAAGVIRYRGAPDESQNEPDHRAAWLRDALEAILNDRQPPHIPSNLIGCPIKWPLRLLPDASNADRR